jgi:dTDP-4-amino-4,6-dideoxygalactose transaminase
VIRCANPHAQFETHRAEIEAAVLRVLRKGRYILGDEVADFEKEFAAFIGAEEGIGVGSGTEAIHLALAACGVGPGDEVITVSHTAVATVAAIELTGATPVFVDIEPRFYTMDPERLESALTPRTKVILPVHLYGQTADLISLLEAARKRGLLVIEDCAQAHGALHKGKRAGSWGDAACFSFYPTKNLGALGDGGMVVTSDKNIAARARLLREYGWEERHVSLIRGWNSRLDEVQAAVLRVKLPFLDRDNARRSAIALKYSTSLAGCDITPPAVRDGSSHVYHLYVARTNHRDALRTHLRECGIDTLIHYPVPVHLQPAYGNRFQGSENLPETEKAAHEILSLPIYPEMGEEAVEKIIDGIRTFGEKSS